MSRSYRHSPVIVQAASNRGWIKRLAAKAVRRVSLEDTVGDGRKYARLYDSYDLKEYSSWQLIGKTRFCRMNQQGAFWDSYFVPVKNRRHNAAKEVVV